jgi:hypothetical protein
MWGFLRAVFFLSLFSGALKFSPLLRLVTGIILTPICGLGFGTLLSVPFILLLLLVGGGGGLGLMIGVWGTCVLIASGWAFISLLLPSVSDD